jgi:protein-S-isoprenylcysteine O-methyltransferase
LYPLPFSGAPIYPSIFWTTYVLWFVLETIAARAKRSSDRAKARDRGSYKLLMILLWVALAMAFAFCFVLPQANILWNRKAVFFVGIALMVGGMAFRFYSMSLLGRFFTYDVAIHAGQTVIEAGPYRYIRHPSYTGGLTTLAGIGLALGNWAALLALLACAGTGYAYRMYVEEAALVAALGEPYKAYMLRTTRLLPFFL